jgi:hypothetical protein
MPESIDESLIIRYLLGQLTEDDETRVEDRVFADRDLLQTVRAVERDLIDEYARGELSESERKQFEHRFVNPPARRERIEFARVFAEAIDEEAPANILHQEVAAASAPTGRGPLAFWRISGWPRYAFAALALLAVLGCAWLVFRSLRSGPVAQQQPGTERPAPEPGGSHDQLPQTGGTPEQRLNAQASPSKGPRERPHSQSSIVALALSAGVARSSENLPELVIRQGTTAVQLRLGIDSEETYTDFRADLKTSSGRPIQNQGALKAQSTPAGKVVIWQVPSAVLNDGEYELALAGVKDNGGLEPVAYYYFRVLNK